MFGSSRLIDGILDVMRDTVAIAGGPLSTFRVPRNSSTFYLEAEHANLRVSNNEIALAVPFGTGRR